MKGKKQPNKDNGVGRIRSTILDRALVRLYASYMGIHHRHQFQSRYYEYLAKEGKTGPVSAPDNAWDGKPIEFAHATNIALFLGLRDYDELEQNHAMPPWSQLLDKADHSQQVFDVLFDKTDNARGVSTGDWIRRELTEAKSAYVGHQWHLNLYGKLGQSFAILVQSEKTVTQLAPFVHDQDQAKILTKTPFLQYPEKPTFFFDAKGWHRIIVIRSKYIPLTAKSRDTGTVVSSQELEQFAFRLMRRAFSDVTVAYKDYMVHPV